MAAFGPFAAAMAFATPARAQDTEPAPPAAPQTAQGETGGVEEIIVTSQKRAENLQDVPLSITAFGTQQLEDLRVEDFDDYAKFLPSLSYTSSGPGFSRVFFRGVSSGDNGNHSGSQPTVGIYLDEQPITTIQGALDVHLYDIERVEALAGPQGTLYGASSQAGTIRIITNKPRVGEFEASYDLEANLIGDEPGYVAEAMVNVPLGEKMAIRLVGWSQHEGGFIDNVFGTRTYSSATAANAGLGQPAVATDNAPFVKEDYNDVDTYGARAALHVDLTDGWTITPAVMGQLQKANGAFNYDPSVGKRETVRFKPERSRDGWVQAALTVEGTIANLDVTYAGSYLHRDDNTRADYSDYSYFYDSVYGSVIYESGGAFVIDPTQFIKGKDRYRRHAHEIRVATPQDERLRFIGGFFFQRQQHRIEQRYLIDDLSLTDYEVTGWSDTIWLTEQKRVDRDYALFGEASLDIIDPLTFTGGIRLFRTRNSLKGYFGLNDDWSGSGNSGETLCSFQAGDARFDSSSWVPFDGISGTAPCTNLDTVVKQDDYTPKVNLTYRFDDERMIYATWSKGFRPGGVNRNSQFPPYKADFLTNYELGFKTSWLDNTLRLNGAFFWQKWDDFQFSYLGVNGLTIITNAGKARIAGFETAVDWVPIENLSLSGGLSILDGELREDFCKDITGTAGTCGPIDFVDFASKGTTLPIVPDYKANLTGRYSFDVGELGAYVQSSLIFQGSTRSALLPAEQNVLGGRNRAYQLVDLSVGVEAERFHAELYVDNVGDERVDVARATGCDFKICTRTAITTGTPRTVGIRFGQKF
ncbi:MAG TPA: TonB-dependent receptor [Myxococcota bacterium]|nr:TonB-dependent receptor [Myxococcota bacterium]